LVIGISENEKTKKDVFSLEGEISSGYLRSETYGAFLENPAENRQAL
jgi:hypothetical protein